MKEVIEAVLRGRGSNVRAPRDLAGAHAALKLVGAIEAGTATSYALAKTKCQKCGIDHGFYEPCIEAPLTD